MAANQTALEWWVLEDYTEPAPPPLEAAEPASQPPALEVERPERASRPVLSQEQWMAALLALVGLLVMGGWLWQAHPQPAVTHPQEKLATLHEERTPKPVEPVEPSPGEAQPAANELVVEWQAVEPAHPNWFPPVVAQAANQLRQVQYAADLPTSTTPSKPPTQPGRPPSAPMCWRSDRNSRWSRWLRAIRG